MKWIFRVFFYWLFLVAKLQGQPSTNQYEAKSTQNKAKIHWVSSNIYRGRTLNKEPVLQAGLEINSQSGTSLGILGNIDLENSENVDQRYQFTHMHIFYQYGVPVFSDVLDIGLRISEDQYPNSIGLISEREIAFYIQANALFNLSLIFSIGIDGEFKGNLHSEAKIFQEVYTIANFSISIISTLSHVSQSDFGRKDGFSNGSLTTSLSYDVANLTLNYLMETDEEIISFDDNEPFFIGIGTQFLF